MKNTSKVLFSWQTFTWILIVNMSIQIKSLTFFFHQGVIDLLIIRRALSKTMRKLQPSSKPIVKRINMAIVVINMQVTSS